MTKQLNSEFDLNGSDLSLKAQYDRGNDMDLHVDEYRYISPTPFLFKRSK